MHTEPRHRTLRSWVYNTLRERIIAGDLEPGATLVEARLSEELGVSRSPIREALRQLGQEGFVRTLQNSATTVTTYEPTDVDQIFEIRDLLESSLLAHAAKARSDAEIQDCQELLERMIALAQAGNIREFAQADMEFHRQLWLMARRPRVVETLLPIADHARRYLNVASRERKFETPATMRASCDEHGEILAGVIAGDVSRAVAAGQKHIQSSRRRILEGIHQRSGEGEADDSDDLCEPTSVYSLSWTGAIR